MFSSKIVYCTVVVLLLGGLALPSPGAAEEAARGARDGTLYLITDAAKLYTVDTGSGAATLVGAATINAGSSPMGMAADSSGALYTISMPDAQLYTIHEATAQSTLVGAIRSFDFPGDGGMDFDPVSGKIHMIDADQNRIWEVDPVTASHTPIAFPYYQGAAVSFTAMTPNGLAYVDGAPMVRIGAAGASAVPTDQVLKVTTADGGWHLAAAGPAGTDGSYDGGMAYDDARDQLYVVSKPAGAATELFRFSVANSAVTTIGEVTGIGDEKPRGLAYVPSASNPPLETGTCTFPDDAQDFRKNKVCTVASNLAKDSRVKSRTVDDPTKCRFFSWDGTTMERLRRNSVINAGSDLRAVCAADFAGSVTLSYVEVALG